MAPCPASNQERTSCSRATMDYPAAPYTGLFLLSFAESFTTAELHRESLVQGITDNFILGAYLHSAVEALTMLKMGGGSWIGSDWSSFSSLFPLQMPYFLAFDHLKELFWLSASVC